VSDYKTILIGYSGHGYVVADAAFEAGIQLNYYADRHKTDVNPFDLVYIGFEGELNFKGWEGDYSFILGIGDNAIRHKVAQTILSKHKTILNVLHPSANIAKRVQIGNGIFFGKNVSVNPLASIGDFCILNTGCIVEHECKLSNAVHIAPGAVLAGNVEVGENSFIGANSVVKQGVKIGKNVVVGAGTVVIRDIEDNSVYVGNPAKKIK
jgi:sugar O-acyltransferase (sialic acid O-acetyltransferase NeuD family)